MLQNQDSPLIKGQLAVLYIRGEMIEKKHRDSARESYII